MEFHTNFTQVEYYLVTSSPTTFGFWIDVRSSNDNRLHGSGRTVERSGILLQIERAADASDGDLVCYVFSLEDAVAHLNTSSGDFLTIEK